MDTIIEKEIIHCYSKDFVVGEYIYIGMGICNGTKVVLSVAYKLDYAIRKAKAFETAANGNIYFDSVNKVKIGALEKETKFEITKEVIS